MAGFILYLCYLTAFYISISVTYGSPLYNNEDQQIHKIHSLHKHERSMNFSVLSIEEESPEHVIEREKSSMTEDDEVKDSEAEEQSPYFIEDLSQYEYDDPFAAYKDLIRRTRECPLMRRLREMEKGSGHRFSLNTTPFPLYKYQYDNYRNKRSNHVNEHLLVSPLTDIKNSQRDVKTVATQNKNVINSGKPCCNLDHEHEHKPYEPCDHEVSIINEEKGNNNDRNRSSFGERKKRSPGNSRRLNEIYYSRLNKRSLDSNDEKIKRSNFLKDRAIELKKRSIVDIEDSLDKTKSIGLNSRIIEERSSISNTNTCCDSSPAADARNKRSVDANSKEQTKVELNKCCNVREDERKISKRSINAQKKTQMNDHQLFKRDIVSDDYFYRKLQNAAEKCKSFLSPDVQKVLGESKPLLYINDKVSASHKTNFGLNNNKMQNKYNFQSPNAITSKTRSKRRVNYLWEDPTFEKLGIIPEMSECLNEMFEVPGFTENGLDWQVLGDHFRHFYEKKKDLHESYALGLYAAFREMTAMQRWMRQRKIQGPYKSGTFAPHYYRQHNELNKPSYRKYIGIPVYGRTGTYYNNEPYVPPREKERHSNIDDEDTSTEEENDY